MLLGRWLFHITIVMLSAEEALYIFLLLCKYWLMKWQQPYLKDTPDALLVATAGIRED